MRIVCVREKAKVADDMDGPATTTVRTGARRLAELYIEGSMRVFERELALFLGRVCELTGGNRIKLFKRLARLADDLFRHLGIRGSRLAIAHEQVLHQLTRSATIEDVCIGFQVAISDILTGSFSDQSGGSSQNEQENV